MSEPALRRRGQRQSKLVGGDFKVLVLDIETSPNLAYVWGLWDQNVGINQLVESQTVLCFAARWLGTKKVQFHSEYHDGREGMIQAAWDLIDEADAVVHFNGRGFDIKHLNREFVLADMGPPSPHRDIDLLTVCRSRFKFPSNKLDYVSQALGIGEKIKHEGMDLWIACMKGDPKAWARMKRYNIGDIQLTEDLYYRLQPWIKSHPHVGLFTGDTHSCPNCGGKDLQRRGYAHTPASVFQKYWCKACGAWSRSAHRVPDSTTLTRGLL